jgi:hypothetical protein
MYGVLSVKQALTCVLKQETYAGEAVPVARVATGAVMVTIARVVKGAF